MWWGVVPQEAYSTVTYRSPPCATSRLLSRIQYLFGYNHEYAVHKGKIELSNQIPEIAAQALSENQRTARIVQDLLTTLGKEYAIEVGSGKESTHYCPFSGGGNVRIFKKGSASAAVVQSTSVRGVTHRYPALIFSCSPQCHTSQTGGTQMCINQNEVTHAVRQ